MSAEILKDLGDGLILRSARGEDADQLVAFNSEIHGTESETRPARGGRLDVRPDGSPASHFSGQ